MKDSTMKLYDRLNTLQTQYDDAKKLSDSLEAQRRSAFRNNQLVESRSLDAEIIDLHTAMLEMDLEMTKISHQITSLWIEKANSLINRTFMTYKRYLNGRQTSEACRFYKRVNRVFDRLEIQENLLTSYKGKIMSLSFIVATRKQGV